MSSRLSIPAYQLHKATGLAKVRIAGKDHHLGPHGSPESRERYQDLVSKPQTDCERAELAWKAQLSTSLSIAELVARYLAHAETYYRKAGKITSEVPNIKIARRPVREQFGFDLVTSVGPRKLKAIRDRWVEGPVKRDQINRRVHRIRRCFKWGVQSELVPVDVHQALLPVEALKRGTTPAPEGSGQRPVPRDHVENILPLVDRRIGAMIQLQLQIGARPGEIVQTENKQKSPLT